MTAIDHLIAKYNGITNWRDYYATKGSKDDAPKHIAALQHEQREVALMIIRELIAMHGLCVSELEVTKE